MATWRCIACQKSPQYFQNDSGSTHKFCVTFSSVKEFAEHLRNSHILVKKFQGSNLYICCYGPTGVCCANERNTTTANSMHPQPLTASFNSQREYEQHLVSCHLKQPPVIEHNNTTVSRRCSLLNSTSPSPGARWSVYNSVVNLPAVLNDPTYRQVDIFARTWGDQFEHAEVLPCPRLPEITEKHFERYLTKLHGTGIQTTRTNGYLGPSENVVLKAVRSSTLSRQFPSDHKEGTVPEDLPSTHGHSLKSVPPMFFEPEFNLQHWRTFSQVIPLHPRHSTTAAMGPTSVSFAKPLDDEDKRLSLDNHLRQARDFRAQHDRLTNYLDIVEVHLAEQVSKKSSIFFEAVCCHDVVHEQLSTALDHIRLARGKLHQVDSSVTNAVMRLHRVVRRRANYRSLLEKLKIIASLQTAQPTIQLLLRSNDFCAALDLVSSTQESLLQFSSDGPNDMTSRREDEDNPPRTANARQITCLRHVHAQLAEISRFVRHMIEAEFEAALNQFLSSRPSGNPYSGPDLIPCLLGLLHIKRYDFVSAFRAELLRQIKLIQTNRPGGNDSSEPSLSLKEQLRSMSNADWIKMVATKCSDLRDLLSRAREAAEIFSTAVQRSIAVDGISPDPTTMPESHLTATVSEHTARELTQQLFVAVQSACTTAQKHVIDMVSLRNRLTLADNSSTVTSASNESVSRLSQPQSSLSVTDSALNRLSSGEFIRLVSVLEEFQEFLLKLSEETRNSVIAPTSPTNAPSNSSPETPPQNSTMALARLLLTLTRNSVQRFHRERSAKLDMILNQERWQAVPVPSQVQDLVNGTFDGSHRVGSEPRPDVHGTASFTPPRSGENSSPLPVNNQPHVQSSDDDGVITPTTLSLNGERYMVVGTVLLLLPIIVDYMQLASRLPCRPIALFDLATRLADLLNSFNSRTCQLVLGAEARKAADLPTISARNLALASRSLQLIAHCVPLLRKHFDRLVASETEGGPPVHPIYAGPKDKRQLDPLEHVENLFNEHIGQINDKLFNLLSNRIQDRLCVWHVRPPTPSSEIRAICRALTRMVEMTGDVMPMDMLTPIVLRAHMEFKTQLRHRLGELAVIADGGPMQSLVDLELTFYVNQIRSLTPSLAKFNDDFADVWPTN